MTYNQAKRRSMEYQEAKESLIGAHGPFSGWTRSGKVGNFALVQDERTLDIETITTLNGDKTGVLEEG